MCGIAGFVRQRGAEPIDREILDRMTATLAHRGPDDTGAWSGEGAFLGHRRLSIIDLAGGHQPMANEDGRVVVAVNGEIYNHHALRDGLLARGHRFATRSDCEVLVHLWEDEGPAMLSRVEGMFAIALWDARDRTLLLARDRMGKKPLFWGLFDGEAVFGSGVRALLAHPEVPRRVDPDALYRYLTMDFVPAPRTMLAGIRKVMPGGYVVVRDGRASEGRYHDLRRAPESPVSNEADAAGRIWDTLVAATRRRLESEVPLGVFLSGGLDSTAVLAAMAQEQDPARIRTFTIGFDDPSYDESGPARAVARHLGTDHHERILDGAEAVRGVRRVAELADDPLADASLIPTHLLSRFAREHVTVALSGDGGDELFYGYPTFLADGPGRLAAAVLPRVARERLLPRAASLLPASERNMSLRFQVERFARGLRHGRLHRHFAWLGSFAPHAALALMTPDAAVPARRDDPYPDVDAWAACCDDWPALETLSALYARLYLADGVLVKVDRASMGVALEVRSPFLDTAMVDLALSLPARWSLRGRTTKALVRRMLRGRVPDAIIDRPKKGFGIPVARWLRTDLKPLMREHLSAPRLAREGLLRPEAVEALVAAHLSGRADHRKELYNLLVLELWMSRWIG
ncbi:MAG TPA: asparagine synthase (glutamine-hydrolyzing) [Myxococcota bacterium]|nr:asparagine synthase (glutamine-hydrolyzing) [Myxococcota bacterium]